MAKIHYTSAISEQARNRLRPFPEPWHKQIGEKMTGLQANLTRAVRR